VDDIEVSTEIEQKHEEKKPRFFKKLFEKKSGQIFFSVVSMCVLVGLFIGISHPVKEAGNIKNVIKRREENNSAILIELENGEKKNGNYFFSGMAFHRTNVIREIYLVINPEDGLEKKAFKVKTKEREDLLELFEQEKSENLVGFEVSVNQDNINPEVRYEILLDIAYVEEKNGEFIEKNSQISTNCFLYDGEIAKVDKKPKVTNGHLQNVIDKGELCFYLKDKGVWMYLYNGGLQWFIDKNIVPEAVQGLRLYIYTNRADLIPESDIEHYLNEGYVYRNLYITEDNYDEESQLYILNFDLPKEYPIVYINHGMFFSGKDKGWVYRGMFSLYRRINKDEEY